jgi:hypothetical protein
MDARNCNHSWVKPKTVETHRENIKFKLGLKGAAALVHAATRWLQAQAIPDGVARRQRR